MAEYEPLVTQQQVVELHDRLSEIEVELAYVILRLDRVFERLNNETD